jgi:hypothetical protein
MTQLSTTYSHLVTEETLTKYRNKKPAAKKISIHFRTLTAVAGCFFVSYEIKFNIIATQKRNKRIRVENVQSLRPIIHINF